MELGEGQACTQPRTCVGIRRKVDGFSRIIPSPPLLSQCFLIRGLNSNPKSLDGMFLTKTDNLGVSPSMSIFWMKCTNLAWAPFLVKTLLGRRVPIDFLVNCIFFPSFHTEWSWKTYKGTFHQNLTLLHGPRQWWKRAYAHFENISAATSGYPTFVGLTAGRIAKQ